MAVKLRLARFGCKHKPFYRVTVTDSRSPRDGKHLEVVGFYNPIAGKDGEKQMSIKCERVRYWLSVGAQATDPVQRLLFRAGVLPLTPVMAVGRKGGPGDAHVADPYDGAS
ncbi:hypothetical protein DM860_000102 [Cuscuta australis]|uniref:Ribosomal protein S16 n=1 Tax=Cuscuta australis TaxID=267555 RepID=A0A328CY96_9ASTE|nr:hypothetical protein DM860_000102 [Cuscuta australis]